MKLDGSRLSRAFTEAPSQLNDAVESAFRRGEQAMKKRYKWSLAMTAAAACMVILAGLALAAGRLTAPRPDPVVTAQTTAQAQPTPEVTPEPTPTPEITPEPTPTPEVTPEPTPTPMLTPAAEIELVYTQPQGNYYHSDPNCSGMVGAVAWTLESALSVGKAPCPVCVEGSATAEEAPEETVEVPMYYTEAGQYYHGNAQCSGMLNAQPHTIELALASGKQRCPICQPIEPDHYDLFVEAFGQGLEALVPGCAYSYSDHEGGTPDFGIWYVTDGEEGFPACRTTSFLKADGGDSRIFSALETPLEDVFCVSFDARSLDNLWPFLSETEAGKTAFDKKDKAVAHMYELARENDETIDVPSKLEEESIWVAIGSDGAIRELEVYYTDAAGGYSAIVGWWLADGEYVQSGRIEPYENRAEPETASDDDWMKRREFLP